MKKKMLTLLFLLGFFAIFPLSFASAQQNVGVARELSEQDKQAILNAVKSGSSNVVIVARVNFYAGEITSQNENEIELKFVLGNKEFVQPGIRYGVELIGKNDKGETVVVDKKLYDEILSLGADDDITRTFKYQIPSFFTGEYKLKLVTYNKDGLLLAFMTLPSPITLTAKGEYIELKNCQVVSGDTGYFLEHGVDIEKGDEIFVECEAQNNSNAEKKYSVKYETYERTYARSFGNSEGVKVETKGEFTFPSGKSTVKIPVYYSEKPQAYDSGITLVKEDGIAVSNTIFAHYVVRGESGTVSNVRLDKDVYEKGDKALVTMFISGNAGQFPGARYSTENLQFDGKLHIVLKDENGEICAEDEVSYENKNDSWIETTTLEVNKNCEKPHIYVELLKTDGSGLYKTDMEVSITEKEVPAEAKKNMILIALIAVFVIIPLAVMSRIAYKKKKRMPVAAIAFLIGAFALFAGVDDASADTYYFYSDHLDTTINWPAAGNYPLNSSATVEVAGLFVRSCANFIFKNVYIYCGIIEDINAGQGSYSLLKSTECYVSSCTSGFCRTCYDYSSSYATFNINTCRRHTLQCVLGVTGGAPGQEASWTTTWSVIDSVALGTVNCTCGDRNGDVYNTTDTTWAAGAFCNVGRVEPQGGPAFPAQGATATWTCAASGGGTSATCSASRKIDGTCGTYNGKIYATADTTWGTGTFCSNVTASPTSPAFPAQGATTTWTCPGANGGATATCSASRKKNGACSTTNARTFDCTVNAWPSTTATSFCSVGTPSPTTPTFPAEGATTTWTCNGVNGGTSTSCSANRNTCATTCTSSSYTCEKTDLCTDVANCGKTITNTATCKDNCGNTVNSSLCGSSCVDSEATCPACVTSCSPSTDPSSFHCSVQSNTCDTNCGGTYVKQDATCYNSCGQVVDGSYCGTSCVDVSDTCPCDTGTTDGGGDGDGGDGDGNGDYEWVEVNP